MKKKNFLFVTWKNDAGQLAWQVKKEGHRVRVYIDYKSCRDCYEGLLEIVSRWQNHINWADVIIFDEIGFGKQAEKLRSQEKKVIGGTSYTDELEWRRAFGQKEMQSVGMQVLPFWEFKDFKSASAFITRNPGRYVFKPSGVVSTNHDLLYVGMDDKGQDVKDYLESNQSRLKHRVKKFILQEFADGVEVAVGGFFNGNKFLTPINVNFEFKRLFAGNIGPLTDDMGSLMFWEQPNELFKRTLKKIEGKLSKIGYVGYFDINCIVNAKGVYPLEFTCRFGYPTLDVQLAGLEMPTGQFLENLSAGIDFKIKTKKGIQLGICCLLPPALAKETGGNGVYRGVSVLTPSSQSWDMPGMYYKDVKFEDGRLRIAGESKYIGVATGVGKTAEAANISALKLAKKIVVSNLFYRIDVGQNWSRSVQLLRDWGYINYR